MPWKIIIFNFLIFTSSFADIGRNLNNLGLTPHGGVAPSFELNSIYHGRINLNIYKNKWVLLVFWATWCGPCQKEMPILQSLYEKFKSSVEILGITSELDTTSIEKFIHNKKITYPILLDEGQKVGASYQNSSVPTLFLLSPEHIIVGSFKGAQNWMSKEALENISEIIQVKKISNEFLKTVRNGYFIENNLGPPQIRISYQVEKPKISKINRFFIEYKNLKVKDYLIYAPEIQNSNLEILNIKSFSKNEKSNKTFGHVVEYKVDEGGRFYIGDIKTQYSPREGGEKKSILTRGEFINLEKKTIGKFFLIPILIIIVGYMLYKKKFKKLV